MENLIIKAADAEDFPQELEGIRDSVFAKDFDILRLQCNLAMLPDVMQQAMPTVKRVTSIRTVCSAMCTSSHWDTFSELHNLIRLPDRASYFCDFRKGLLHS